MKKILTVAFLGCLVGVISSCSPKTKEDIKVPTKQVVSQLQVMIPQPPRENGVFKPTSALYEEVDIEWLLGIYTDYFRSELFKDNITGWENRANCVLFCEYFILKANLLYYRQSFHSGKQSSRLSMGILVYNPDPSKPLEQHAIVTVYSRGQVIYVDPQLPKGKNKVILTPEQIKTISLIFI